jgi:hypothetical protein
MNLRIPTLMMVVFAMAPAMARAGDPPVPTPPPAPQAPVVERPESAPPEPFAFADFGWLNGGSRIRPGSSTGLES